MLPMTTEIEVRQFSGLDDPSEADEPLIWSGTLSEFASANADEVDELTIRRLRIALKTTPTQVIGGGATPPVLICLPE